MWRIEFTSSEFLPLLPEECQGNPGVYGFELAWWLAQTLAATGVVTSYPVGEDWGWLIEHVNSEETEFTIGCASMADEGEGEGYAGKEVTWSVFIRPHTSLKQRFKGQTHEQEVHRLGQQVLAVLKRKDITPEASEA